MFKKLFVDHPASVNETYFQHFGVAMGFATRLFVATCACLVHAFVPGMCVKTGSKIITGLHDKMVANRVQQPPKTEEKPARVEEPYIEYMI